MRTLPQRSAAIVTLLAILPACSWFGGDSPTNISPLVEFTPAAKATIAWSAGLPKMKSAFLEPSYSGGRVYAAAPAGELMAVDASSGRQLWRINTKQQLTGAVGSGAGLVVVGTSKGELIAFAEDGKERWRSLLAGELLAPPRVDAETVVVRTADGQLIAVGAADGKRKWALPRTNPPLVLRNLGAVNIKNQTAYAGFAGGRLAALALETGSPIWETNVGVPRGATELERVTDVVGPPLVDDDEVCVAAYRGKIGCFDRIKGTPIWSREFSSPQAISGDAGFLYGTDDRGAVMAFQRIDGTTRWKQDKLSGRKVTGPGVIGQRVAVGDLEGYVHILSGDDGRFVARIATDGSPVVAAPLPVQNRFIVQTRKGGLYSIAVE
jgi:outer membrane protein assembly factor BamB